MAIGTPVMFHGEYQTLRLSVKLEAVPSAYATVKVCDFWLPSTPVARIFKAPNLPAGRVTVSPVTTSGALAGPSRNKTPSHSCVAPTGCSGSANPPPSRLEVSSNVDPSV